jgi:hypothetical protein
LPENIIYAILLFRIQNSSYIQQEHIVKIEKFSIDKSLQFIRGQECKKYIDVTYISGSRKQRFIISKVLNFVQIALVDSENINQIIARCLRPNDFRDYTKLSDVDPEVEIYKQSYELLYEMLISALRISLVDQSDDDLFVEFDYEHKAGGTWPVKFSRLANATLISIQRTEVAKVEFLVEQRLEKFMLLMDTEFPLRLSHFVQQEFEYHIVVEGNLISTHYRSGNEAGGDIIH